MKYVPRNLELNGNNFYSYLNYCKLLADPEIPKVTSFLNRDVNLYVANHWLTTLAV